MNGKGDGNPVRSALVWSGAFAVVFVVLAWLVATGKTESVDRSVLTWTQMLAASPLDLAASMFNMIGQAEVTAPIAVILAFVWWRRRGARGLVPLLLFVGVAIEIVLKHLVPHPSPAPALSRNLHLLPFLKSAAPYTFPSGHMFRLTFLAALTAERSAFWILVAAMAFTRLYLAEHWASDVVAGTLLGLILAGIGAAIYATRPAK